MWHIKRYRWGPRILIGSYRPTSNPRYSPTTISLLADGASGSAPTTSMTASQMTLFPRHNNHSINHSPPDLHLLETTPRTTITTMLRSCGPPKAVSQLSAPTSQQPKPPLDHPSPALRSPKAHLFPQEPRPRSCPAASHSPGP